MKRTIFLLLPFSLVFIITACNNNDGSIINEPDPIGEPEPNPEPEPDREITGESIIYNYDLVDDGYVLLSEVTNHRVYLITKEKGELIYEWEIEYELGNDAELMTDGKLLVSLKSENPSISYGGYGGRVQIINPDGSLNWDFEYSSDNYIAHHDVELLPNNNVLILVWEKKTKSDAELAGYNDINDIEFLVPEAIIEVTPTNNSIVWEWHSWDHLVQDVDNTKENYGDVSQNPGLINLNYAPRENGDIMHANGIDYDAEKDIIFLSINFYNEVWVIDHSTSTKEAASHTGGAFNKGGDLIYRFGNPSAYNNSFGEQIFFNNHFPNILEGDDIGKGNMLIYMNGNVDKQSAVFELKMPETLNLEIDSNNEPQVLWEFTDSDLYSPILGGAVRLPNGNTLIAEPSYGFWEITDSGEVVWKFKNDVLVWRGYSYSKNDPAIQSLGL